MDINNPVSILRAVQHCHWSRPADYELQLACAAGAEALEILAWMEATIGECSWGKKSWSVIAGRPDIVCLKPGEQIGGGVTYGTMLDAIRAAKEKSNVK